MRRMTPFLWFEGRVGEAIALYTSVFPESKVVSTMPGPEGSVMSATFELDGQQFIAYGGGTHLKLTPAASIMVVCETQEEIDRIWNGLTKDGTESECGWLIDPFGLSWQVIPSLLPKLTGDPDREKAGRAIQAMFKMKKIDIATLERAFAGRGP